MTDHTPLPATTDPAVHDPLAFTPVPRAAPRSNGWKPHVQRAFIEALAQSGSVKAAAARVGRSTHGAYLLRRHPEAASFAAAWDAAIDCALAQLEDATLTRALHGTERKLVSAGKLVATEQVHNDRLAMFFLRTRMRGKYGTPNTRPDAIGKMELARLKKQWRKEWEEERRSPDAEERAERIVRDFCLRLRAQKEALESQKTQDLYAAYLASAAEDKARHIAERTSWYPHTKLLGGEVAADEAGAEAEGAAVVDAEWDEEVGEAPDA